MTATDILRRLLDERGVEYTEDHGYREFFWDFGESGMARASAIGTKGLVQMIVTGITPEQAIAATLGHYNAGRYVGLRRGEYWERTENSNYYCGCCGWKVTDHDSFCSECGGALHKTTLGSCNCSDNCTDDERTGTCYPVISDNLTESEGTGDAWADCSECGHLLFVLTDPNSQVPNFCPNCGRRVEQ